MKRKMFIIPLTVAVLLIFSACSNSATSLEKSNQGKSENRDSAVLNTTSTSPAETTTLPNADASGSAQAQPISPENGEITAEKAKEIAFGNAGVKAENASFTEVEYDRDDGIPSYEVEFKVGYDEYDYDIHVETGEILTAEKNGKSILATEGTSLKTAADAKGIALSHAGFTENEVRGLKAVLDTEKGRRVYEVEFKANAYEYDYEINAETGEIIWSEKDFDD